jgi:sentrin-specific protease 1
VAVYFKDRSTVIYDSLIGYQTRESDHATIRRYLCDEYQSKYGREFHINEWTTETPGPSAIPQQENGNDCGVFTWLYAACCSIGRPFDFTQEDIPLIRQFITHIIYHFGVRASDVERIYFTASSRQPPWPVT